MASERRVHYRSSIAAERERAHILQFLQADLSQTQAGNEDERLRVLGLSKFYLQMANPSLEFLEAVSGSLVKMPFGHLRELRSAANSAADNPKQFFGKHEVEIEDFERLSDGVSHSRELLDNIVHRYDYETGEISWGGPIDPKVLAESTYQRIQIRTGERQIGNTVEQVRNEQDLRKRYRKGLKLKKQVLDYVNGFPFTFFDSYDREEQVPPTWANLSRGSRLSVQLDTMGGTSVGNFGVSEAVSIAQAAISRYAFEKKLKKLPTLDQNKFDQLRFRFGAKAANLMILSENVGEINNLRKNFLSGDIVVPEFKVVSVDSFRAWREGKLLDIDLRPYFEWASGLKENDAWWAEDKRNANYIVRSSAVFSEDGATVTGAGIYESVWVGRGSTFSEFKDAVTKVYESVDSPKAIAYRTEHGIEQEEMGLVVQKFITPRVDKISNKSSEGYINSRLTGVPSLIELVTGTSRNFINREALDFFLALDPHDQEGAFRRVHHFRPDLYKVNADLVINVAQYTSAIERIWNRDVQCEFVVDGSSYYFVQVRELPPTFSSQGLEVQFPEETPIYSGASVGVGDVELSILDSHDDNSDKVGAAIFIGNYGWTNKENDYRLPKEGAVIIYNSDGTNGHIQTICAEKGLICVFPDANEDENSAPYYSDLEKLKRVRIVSNGIEARVYEKQEDYSEPAE
jgi:hypothetical protein